MQEAATELSTCVVGMAPCGGIIAIKMVPLSRKAGACDGLWKQMTADWTEKLTISTPYGELTNQTLLREIAVQTPHGQIISWWCMAKLTDQSTWFGVFLRDITRFVRKIDFNRRDYFTKILQCHLLKSDDFRWLFFKYLFSPPTLFVEYSKCRRFIRHLFAFKQVQFGRRSWRIAHRRILVVLSFLQMNLFSLPR